ncbi:MAG: PH domain-containing protein, partial [bacterium]|nr:PH domain-containing protein [bacterium]
MTEDQQQVEAPGRGPSSGESTPAGHLKGEPQAPAEGSALWRRVHKATPVIKSWQVIAALMAAIAFYAFDDILRNFGRLPALWIVGAVLGILVVALLISLVYSYFAWKRTAYAIGADAVYFHKGILFRSQRHARLNRIQGVDITRPLLGRLVGLSSLAIETAGGGDSKVVIEYLKDEEAERLRTEVLARAAGLKARQAGEDPAAPSFARAPERVVNELPAGQLVVSLLLSLGTIIGVIALVVAFAIPVALGEPMGLVGMLPVFFIFASVTWVYFSGHFGHTLAISPDGIRLRHGLLSTQSQTIPPGRIQAVKLTQPFLWRGKDWWKVEINVAGYGISSSTDNTSNVLSRQVLLPVASREIALRALWLVQRDLGVDDPQSALDAGMVGSLGDAGFMHSPRSARWVDPISWKRNGLLITRSVMLMRSGRITRELVVVPHERTQSLGVAQGPIQRRLQVATFEGHSVPGPVLPRAKHLPQFVAMQVLAQQAQRAREARAKERPEEWMRRVGAVGVPVEEA